MSRRTRTPDADLIAGIIDRARALYAQAQAAGQPLTEDHWRQLSTTTRHDWAGRYVYIAKKEGDIHSRRRHAILAQYKAGTPVDAIARKEGISARQVYRVIKARPTLS